MTWRRAQKADIPAIKALWEKAQYGFDFPDLGGDRIISSWVAEQGDQIVCWAGAQVQPEIIAIMDSTYGSPHRRVALFGSFHRRVAEDIREAGFERSFCTLDPKFPKFGKRLARFGWLKGWDYWFNLTERVLGRK